MRRSVSTIALGVFLTLAGTAMAGQDNKPPQGPCGTSGPLSSTDISPATYSYVQTSGNSQSASFTVFSPSINITGSCNSTLPYVYGNGDSGADIDVEVGVTGIYNGDGSTPNLTEDQLNAFKNAFYFSPSSFTLLNPGAGSQAVTFTFTNTSAVPPGEYAVKIAAKLANPDSEKGLGIGPATGTFTVNVTEPQQVRLDTLAPTVTITSPGNGSALKLNAKLHAEFTAVDPGEDGVGTGVWATRAFVTSCGESRKDDKTGNLSNTPALSVVADETVTVTEDETANQIGTFTLVAEADDNATPEIHTGTAGKTFTVGVGVAALPPISVTGKQFKTKADVPIKWAFSDDSGAFLPPFASVTAVVTSPSGSATTYLAGEGVNAIRWALDTAGNALQYIANYTPSAVGTHKVDLYVNDVCGTSTKQGGFTFYVAR